MQQHMTAEQWQQVKSLLERALERPAEERADWLERECPDPLTRSEVWSLVEAHTAVEDFLEQQAGGTSQQLAEALRPESLVGERIGPWRLVEEIGRGGMGTVYRAVRADDEFRREVAIKIVGRGYDTELLLRRFRTERQILANLEHPYIARLIDGGTTPDGRPYFVMEYVGGGVPLTEYCDRQRLGINERIELFRKVCSAVEYAHENLIVHRDLKPANILVTPGGVPKLLDFGIARLLNGSGREMSEPTVTMLRMATPAYASPEQIRGCVAGIPSDIYSLGVILYELLTGHRPYRLPAGDSADLARVICEREPTRASIVVGFTESLERSNGEMSVVSPEPVCDARDTTLDQLRRRLRGDLDNITATALRKEPHRRYESVGRFSQDLHRHVAGLPIVAARDTVGYRTGKFIERNRVAVSGGVLVTLLLSLSSVVALHKASRLSHRLEEDQRLATSFLVDIHDSIARLPGSTPAREALLQHSLKYLDGLSRDAGDDPVFRRSLGMAWEKFAELQIGMRGAGLGRSADALETCRKALAIRESLAAANPQDMQLQHELAKNYLLAGYIAGRAGGSSARREYDRKALEITERLVGEYPRDRNFRSALAQAHVNIAYALQFEDKWDPLRKHLNEAVAIQTELAAENPSDAEAQRELANVHYRLATSYVEAGQPTRAEPHLEQALAIQKRLSQGDPDNSDYRADRAATHHFLGYALGSLARTAESLRHFDQAIELRQSLLAQDPRDTRNRYMLAGNYSKRAAVLFQAGDLQRALDSARKGVELQQLALAYDPKGVPARISMAEFEGRLAEIYMALAERTGAAGHWTDATSLYRQALERYDGLIAEGNLTSPGIRAEAERARDALARCEARKRLTARR